MNNGNGGLQDFSLLTTHWHNVNSPAPVEGFQYVLIKLLMRSMVFFFVPNPHVQVLKLLRIAWERKLTFTIGTSVTTGAVDTLVWNEIHHKTESTSNHSGHGYPDPKYLDNVLMELAAQGVEDDTDKDVIAISSDSDSDL